jgi:hypothetical protein
VLSELRRGQAAAWRPLLAALILTHSVVGGVSATAAAAVASAPVLDSSTLILTVGERPVYWPEFRFWLKYLFSYARSSGSTATQWRSLAADNACNDIAIEQQSAVLGVKLTSADLAHLAKAHDDGVRIYGSRSEYQRIVASMYGSEELYQYLSKIDLLGDHLYTHLYGADGAGCNDACVDSFARAKELMNVRYIFHTNPEVLKKLHRQLQRDNAAPALFQSLMSRYSQDQSLRDFPDGRLLARGVKGTPFDAAYSAMADGTFSGIVNGKDGSYIIQRLPILPGMSVDTSGTRLRYWAAYQHLYKPQVSVWCKQLSTSFTDTYQQLDPARLIQ